MGMHNLRLNKVYLLPHSKGTSQHTATCAVESLLSNICKFIMEEKSVQMVRC
jgi:hypothetical protein